MYVLPRIVGKFNEIHESAKIAESTRVCGWCYIGHNVEIGENTVIGNFCEINAGSKIGKNTLINSHCHINSNTIIGNGTIFGAGVLTADEKFMTARTTNIKKKPCIIGDDCRIGQGSNLISTKIGNHVSIGANSVVLEPEIQQCEVWVGTPAKFLRKMTDYELSL